MDSRSTDNCQIRLFGQWRFNIDTGSLSDGETTTRLEPQVGKLLDHFLSHQNKVITRDELIAAAWENRIVSDDAINRCISILRHILTPQDKNVYIETVVRRGYLAHFPPPPAEELRRAGPIRRSAYFIATAVATLAAISFYFAVNNVAEPPWQVLETAGENPPMVAVLPFTAANLEGDSKFFANGVHDDLLTQLAKLQSIRVISRTSVTEYRNHTQNLREIGEELGADAILEGGVQIAEGRLHINVQLIDARSDAHLWAESYDRELTPANIFEVQADIARVISVALHTTLTPQDNNQLKLIPTENMAAYRAYHQAMEFRDRADSSLLDPLYRQALEEAVRLDPTFIRAWAELVVNLAYLNFQGDRPEMTPVAEQALQRLKAIAPESAEYRIAQAAYVYYVLKDYNRAHVIISRAVEMNPSDIRAIGLKSWIERRQGNFAAWVESRKETRNLDPRNPLWTGHLLNALLLTHRYDEAWLESERSSLQNFSTNATRELLLFRGHRDFKHLQESMEKICQFHEQANCGWGARIANRDFVGALDSLAQKTDEFDAPGLSDDDHRRIFTYWLMGEDLPTGRLGQWQSQLDRDVSGGFRQYRSYLGSAMLAGAQGNTDESALLIQRWFRLQPIDWAHRANTRHEACRVLGMIKATHAAVNCIRDGLMEASYVNPFFEPYLPYYDSLRDEPEFIEMLVDIDGARPAPTMH